MNSSEIPQGKKKINKARKSYQKREHEKLKKCLFEEIERLMNIAKITGDISELQSFLKKSQKFIYNL